MMSYHRIDISEIETTVCAAEIHSTLIIHWESICRSEGISYHYTKNSTNYNKWYTERDRHLWHREKLIAKYFEYKKRKSIPPRRDGEIELLTTSCARTILTRACTRSLAIAVSHNKNGEEIKYLLVYNLYLRYRYTIVKMRKCNFYTLKNVLTYFEASSENLRSSDSVKLSQENSGSRVLHGR